MKIEWSLGGTPGNVKSQPAPIVLSFSAGALKCALSGIPIESQHRMLFPLTTPALCFHLVRYKANGSKSML